MITEQRLRRTRSVGILAVAGALSLVAGCNPFDRQSNDMSKLQCGSTGCQWCESGSYGSSTCRPYTCSDSSQCPSSYSCTAAQRCMPVSSTAGGGGGGGTTTPATICITAADCVVGQICHNNACVASTPTGGTSPTVACSTSAQCAQGQTCKSGTCVAGTGSTGTGTTPPAPECKVDADCGAARLCDKGTCIDKKLPLRPEGTCQFKSDCGQNGTCINTKCYFPPGAKDACPPGSLAEAGLCMPSTAPKKECQFSSDCNKGMLCVNATCIQTCKADVDCAQGNLCGQSGLCALDDRPLLQCETNADCAAQTSCVDGRCLAACSHNAGSAACVKAAEECAFGYCMPAATCFEQKDCKQGLDCINGGCDVLLTATSGQGTGTDTPAEPGATDAPSK